jgi:hypothetical protein
MKTKSWLRNILVVMLFVFALGYRCPVAADDSTPQTTIEKIQNQFKEKEVIYSKLSESKLLVPYTSEGFTIKCLVVVDDSNNLVSCYAIPIIKVPADKRGTVLELLTRINLNMLVGDFEFSLDTGVILYKTTVDTRGNEFTKAFWKALGVGTGVTAKYSTAINKVIYGDKSPKEILEEKAPDSSPPKETPEEKPKISF